MTLRGFRVAFGSAVEDQQLIALFPASLAGRACDDEQIVDRVDGHGATSQLGVGALEDADRSDIPVGLP